MKPTNPILFVSAVNERDDDCACPDRAFVLSMDHHDNEIENDCACPDKAFTLQHQSTDATFYQKTEGVHTAELPNDFYLAFSPYAPAGPSVLNEAAWQRWQTFTSPQALSESVDVSMANEMLVHPANRPPRPIAQKPETLTAWMHVTNACNLDCPYCYVRKSSERMSEATGLQAIESLFLTAQQYQFKRVKLKYAGGEATLHFSLIRRLHERAIELASKAGLELKEVILSNGVHLRPQDADWLVESGIKLMVSLDGIGELHDRLRPQKNGGDTFDKVQNTIDSILLPRGIRPDVTMTITGINAHGVAEVAKWAMIDRRLPTSFNFYRQNIQSVSRINLEIEEKAIIEGMLAAYQVIEADLPTYPFLNGLLDRVQAEAHSHTCGVGQNYVVITHKGQIAQCQMHLNQSVKAISSNDLLLSIISGPIQNISVDHKVGCRTCEYRYRCSGGCPIETYRASGRWDVQSPNCTIYKTLFPQALRLDGLRLMKLHGHLN